MHDMKPIFQINTALCSSGHKKSRIPFPRSQADGDHRFVWGLELFVPLLELVLGHSATFASKVSRDLLP